MLVAGTVTAAWLSTGVVGIASLRPQKGGSVPATTRDPDHLDDVFAHGVASGDPLADRVIIWTQVTAAEPEVDVGWTVAVDEKLKDVVASGRTRTDGRHDFTVKLDVVGLQPATTYYYRFEACGQGSQVGQTRTAPAGEMQRWRLALTSCAKGRANRSPLVGWDVSALLQRVTGV